MSQLTENQVDLIANLVASKLKQKPVETSAKAAVLSVEGQTVSAGTGVFNSVESAVAASRKAYAALNELTLEQRTEIIGSIRAKMRIHGDDLAQKAFEETQMGRPEDKILKNKLVTEKTQGTEAGRPSLLHLRDRRRAPVCPHTIHDAGIGAGRKSPLHR